MDDFDLVVFLFFLDFMVSLIEESLVDIATDDLSFLGAMATY